MNMLSLNISNILYLSFRFGPLVLVSYFILSSLFSQDFKSIIYLAGLITTCFVVILVSNSFDKSDSPYICNQVTLTGSAPMSALPLSVTVYFFTFTYLLMALFLPAKSMVESNYIARNNIALLILFPLIIIVDILWLLSYSCSNFIKVSCSAILGSGCGALWAYSIFKSQLSSLLFLTRKSNAEVCSQMPEKKLRCRRVMRNTSSAMPSSSSEVPGSEFSSSLGVKVKGVAKLTGDLKDAASSVASDLDVVGTSATTNLKDSVSTVARGGE